jgi:tetratricopeptide (TPR) repeat protein
MFIRGRMPPVWQGGLIVLLVFLAYLPALRGGFIWDDDAYVTENPTLHDWEGLRQIWFKVGAVPQYYPMVHTTFWLEYHLWGFNPFGYHLVNILLHAIAAILFWRVLLRLRVPGAWLAAVIFALHPVEVESVAWITERKNVLSTVFYFTAALAYLRFAAWEEPGGPNRLRRYWYLGALVLFLAALLSKTVTCSLPAALLLLCWWKKGRVKWGEILPLLPFFVLGVGLGLMTAWIEKYHVGARGAEWSLTFVERCLIAGRALWFYAGKLAWPAQLTFIYPRWTVETAAWWQWLFPLAAAVVMAGLWRARQWMGKGPLVAVLFFAGTLVPALGFVNVYPMRYSFVADHFQYLASAGLITLCAAGLHRIPRVFPALVVLLGALTWRQAGIYRNQEILWHDTLIKNPDCWMAHTILGVLLDNQGHLEKAMEHYHEAIQINPNSTDTLNDLGVALAAMGRFEEAIENFNKAIQTNPNYFQAINNLGLVLATQGRLDAAIENYRRAVQINPDYHIALNNLGLALAAQGRFDEAVENYRAALRISPNYYAALNSLGIALTTQGRPEEAIADFQQAVQIEPHHADFHLNWGVALDQLRRNREAAAQYREALRLNPDLIAALNNLAWILASNPDDKLRDGVEAVRLAERACDLTHHREPLLIGTLAAAYAEAGRFPEAVTAAEKAEQLATAAGLTAVAVKNRHLLELYRVGKPYHEPSPTRH